VKEYNLIENRTRDLPACSVVPQLNTLPYPPHVVGLNQASTETTLLLRHYPFILDRLCGLVVRVHGYRSRGPGSVPGATRFSEK
jgi:hypothetical protein